MTSIAARMSSTPLSASKRPIRFRALSHSALVLSVMSTPGSSRQNRSGHTAMKPLAARSSHTWRITALTPKISWIATTAGALGSAGRAT